MGGKLLLAGKSGIWRPLVAKTGSTAAPQRDCKAWALGLGLRVRKDRVWHGLALCPLPPAGLAILPTRWLHFTQNAEAQKTGSQPAPSAVAPIYCTASPLPGEAQPPKSQSSVGILSLGCRPARAAPHTQ